MVLTSIALASFLVAASQGAAVNNALDPTVNTTTTTGTMETISLFTNVKTTLTTSMDVMPTVTVTDNDIDATGPKEPKCECSCYIRFYWCKQAPYNYRCTKEGMWMDKIDRNCDKQCFCQPCKPALAVLSDKE